MTRRYIQRSLQTSIPTNRFLAGSMETGPRPIRSTASLQFHGGCVLARGSTAASRFIYTVVKESDIVDGTLEKLFDHLAYSMNILVRGVYPEFGFSGRPHPLAGQAINSNGWRMSIIFLKGTGSFCLILFTYPAGTTPLICALNVEHPIQSNCYCGRDKTV